MGILLNDMWHCPSCDTEIPKTIKNKLARSIDIVCPVCKKRIQAVALSYELKVLE
jgi:hypothetical protein